FAGARSADHGERLAGGDREIDVAQNDEVTVATLHRLANADCRENARSGLLAVGAQRFGGGEIHTGGWRQPVGGVRPRALARLGGAARRTAEAGTARL